MGYTMPCMNGTLGWGIKNEGGIEVWDARPIFSDAHVGWLETFKLLFYPKKLMLYWHIVKALKHESIKIKDRGGGQTFKVLDEGCGTGAAVIEMKKLWGEAVEVVGTDVIQLENEIAKERMKEYGVDARIVLYDAGGRLPFEHGYFDAVHTSDVLGHVQNVPFWLSELSRVLKSGGTLAMFSESKLGKHAYIRNYLQKHGVNTDPHAEFHISLYSKQELQRLLEEAGFEIEYIYTTVWAKFFVHPDEIYPTLQKQKGLLIFRVLNALLYWLKKLTHPLSTALCELYCLVEMLLLGKRIESQGYIILGRKRGRGISGFPPSRE